MHLRTNTQVDNVHDVISLHIRSMWETICDALPHSSYQNLAARNFGSKFLECRQPENADLDRSWHFWGFVGTGMWRLIAVSPKDTISIFAGSFRVSLFIDFGCP